jgi:hypothetical protein
MDEQDGADDEVLDPGTEARRGLDPAAKVCGNCLMWKPQRQDLSGRWVGPCRLMAGRGDLAPTAPTCERFLPRGSKIPQSAPVESTRHRAVTLSGPTVRRAGVVAATARPAAPDVEIGDILAMTRNELVEILREAMGDAEPPRLAPKWEGGIAVLRPGNSELAPKEIPLDALFHKVVGIRDRLRVLEQKINGHPKLSDAEKVDLQTYLTRCYGSLTTFNVLFRDKGDQFVGERGKDD